MAAKRQAIALGLTLVFGIAVGVHSGPVPETRYIKGPTVYKTHVVTETKEVTTPLPDSCVRALELIPQVTRPLYHQDGLVTESIDAISEWQRAHFIDEINSSNEAVQTLRRTVDRLGTNNVDSAEALAKFNPAYDQCIKEQGVS